MFVLTMILLLVGQAVAQFDEPRPLFVEGYAKQVSYAPGEELTLHVSTSASEFAVEILRIGGETKSIWSKGGLEGHEYPVPENASSHGCNWPAAVSIPIPADQQSGYYQVNFRVRDRGGKFIQRNQRTAEGSCFFIVRSAEPGRKQRRFSCNFQAILTNAYNNWGGI